MKNLIIGLFIFIFILIFGNIFINNYDGQLHPFIPKNPDIQNIAHRGGMGLAPENTIISFDKAVEVGADILVDKTLL